MSADLCFLSVKDASDLIASGRLCPVDLTVAHLERIRAVDGALKSHVLVTEELAYQCATDWHRRHPPLDELLPA